MAAKASLPPMVALALMARSDRACLLLKSASLLAAVADWLPSAAAKAHPCLFPCCLSLLDLKEHAGVLPALAKALERPPTLLNVIDVAKHLFSIILSLAR